jgi:hypothetical protein
MSTRAKADCATKAGRHPTLLGTSKVKWQPTPPWVCEAQTLFPLQRSVQRTMLYLLIGDLERHGARFVP